MEKQVLHKFDVSREYEKAQCEKVEKASRRTCRLGLSAYRYEVERYIHKWNDNGEARAQERSIVTVLGEPKKVADWEFVATVDWSLGTPILNIVPETTVKLVKPETRVCEHCNKVRSRNETFLVTNSVSGETKQVGRSCLAAYTGIPVGWVSEWSRDWNEESVREEGHQPTLWATEEIIALSVKHIDQYGYVSSKASEEQRRGSTKSSIIDILVPTPKFREEAREYRTSITDEQRAIAAEVIAWATEWAGEDWENNYRDNLRNILGAEWLGWRHLGYAVSAYASYRREQGEGRVTVKVKAEKQPLPVGKGIVIEGTVITTDYRDSGYGMTPKWLVEGAGGWRVWGSVPADVENALGLLRDLDGHNVRFVANVEVSTDDDTFGFASRPRKVEILPDPAPVTEEE